MSEAIPFRPTGSNFEAQNAQKVHDKVFGPSSKIRNTRSVQVSRNHDGIFLTVKTPRATAGKGLLGPFQIDVVEGDYLICFAYDPINEIRTGTVPVYIAKEDKQQNSLTTETIFGVVHNYTYQDGDTPPQGFSAADSNNAFRIDNYGSNTAVQRIIPPWVCGVDGEIIWAQSATTGVDGPAGLVTLLIAGRSCQWGVVSE